MPRIGLPESSTYFGIRGAPSAYTLAGPPERMKPLRLSAPNALLGRVVREQLAVHVVLAHAARDELAVL